MLNTKEGISIILPVRNECSSLPEVIKKIFQTFENRYKFEIVIVDDNSNDYNFNEYKNSISSDKIILISLNKNSGQSRAIDIGIKNSKYEFIFVIDSDGQIDPADFLKIEDLLNNEIFIFEGLVIGDRTKNRKDSLIRKFASNFAKKCRKFILSDELSDSGCGFRYFKKTQYLSLPYFNNMHRYLHLLFKRDGYDVMQVDIKHYNRQYGISKYGNIDRLIDGIFDIFGVLWLLKRKKIVEYKKINLNE